ncbi:uncharacterized protein BKA78DRAFT_323460 [Phyllosticta capitalensis]|uniref:uncharacterized protein n=1 Tax=Phyllosticta capitalensis TaxID=121624 RepID=UPI00312EDD90
MDGRRMHAAGAAGHVPVEKKDASRREERAVQSGSCRREVASRDGEREMGDRVRKVRAESKGQRLPPQKRVRGGDERVLNDCDCDCCDCCCFCD